MLLCLVLVALDSEKPRLTAVTERNGPLARLEVIIVIVVVIIFLV
jgi:hypothetical protein